MKLTVLGSSGGSASRTSPASGYLLQSGTTSVWLDAGPGTFMALAGHVDPGTLDAVVLSHVHVDHCADIFALYGYMAYGPSGHVPIDVYVPEGLDAHLSGFARAAGGRVFHQVFAFHTVGADDHTSVGGLGLTFIEMNHPVPTIGTRAEEDGMVLAYSADTGPGDGLGRLAAGADLLLCEASLQGPAEEREYPYHLTAEEAGRVAGTAGAGHLVVTHISPTLDEKRSLQEARATFSGEVDWAAPGSVFEL